MKSMTCRQLGGACDLEFAAESFEDMADLSRKHGEEMHRIRDPGHLEAMRTMQARMKDPGGMEKWFESKRREFESLPDDQPG